LNGRKIFCIGFQKTGTSSMGRALEHLGFNVCGAVGLKEPNIAENIKRIAFEQVPNYDAFQDNPWPILFRDLDAAFPGSKFIMTRRDSDSWIRSVLRHFGSTPHAMQEWIYGVPYPNGNEQIFLDRYHRHEEEVLAYFSRRPDDLLILDIESEDLWSPLAGFLSLPPPTIPFPHTNKGGSGWKAARWARRRMLRIKYRFARTQQ
jgi:hypothetical protein